MSRIGCGRYCDACPAAARCGKKPNFCLQGRCADCFDPERMMVERRQVVEHLGGLDLGWPRRVRHPVLPELPDHLPVLVQAYADPVDVPWIALHGGRVFGTAGRWVTRKHRRPIREVYRLRPDTKVALQMYVEDRVLEGFWVAGGRKIHAEVRAHRETVEDIALLDRAVRPDVRFILGGIHSLERLIDYRRAAPRRQLVICNGMAYGLAQRRRLLARGRDQVARSA